MTWLHVVIDVPPSQHEAGADFWAGALGWPVGPSWPDHPELRSFEPPRGAAYVHLQRVEGPARIHLDLEADDPGATVARAVELGAQVADEHDRWSTLLSPGGLPFCLLEVQDHEPPEPVTFSDGHRARMVQVCIDSSRAAHDREVAFWRALLLGRFVESDADEFAGKWHDDAGSPLQLLFQRLGEGDGPVRAHLDHGTDDLPAEVRRLVDLGAADVAAPGRGWHVLRDPAAGLTFCVTENSPEQGQHRDIG
jgi:hypothetical protein